jgi:hypothetical protein
MSERLRRNNVKQETQKDVLQVAIERARALLAFAAGSGVSVDKAVVAAIVKCHGNVQQQPASLSAEDEAAFWVALSTLAHSVVPVTAESLAETQAELLKKGFFRSIATRWIAAMSVVAIVITLACQIYWAMLASRIDTYKNAQVQWSKVNSADSTATTEEKTDVNAARSAAETLLGQMILIAGKLPASLRETEGVRRKAILEEAQNIADSLYKLILPALYGLLGSIIYALRNVSQQIRENSYTWGARLAGIGRMLLGPVMGFASLVLIPGLPDNPTLKNLPPLAIALVAGYSVDLIFSVMDRIIRAFQPEPSARSPR